MVSPRVRIFTGASASIVHVNYLQYIDEKNTVFKSYNHINLVVLSPQCSHPTPLSGIQPNTPSSAESDDVPD